MAKNTSVRRKGESTPALKKPAAPAVKVDEAALIADLRDLIQSARERVAMVANAAHALLYYDRRRR